MAGDKKRNVSIIIQARNDASKALSSVLSSLSSFAGFFEVAAYTASKSAVAGLTRALAVEWARAGVTVNAIVPGVCERTRHYCWDTPSESCSS